MASRRTYKSFLSEFNEVQSTNPNPYNKHIKIVGTYEKMSTPIAVKCTECGSQWMVRPSSLLTGVGCNKCARQGRRYTSNEFLKNFNTLGNTYPKLRNIKIVGEYVNCNTPIEVQCKICNNKWKIPPKTLRRGHGCRKCYPNQSCKI